jgi:hypothetical protein
LTLQRREARKVYARADYAREKAWLDAVGHKCTACEEDCQATFVCISCGDEKRVCSHLVGGFGSTRKLCDLCLDEDNLPPAILALWRKKIYSTREVV